MHNLLFSYIDSTLFEQVIYILCAKDFAFLYFFERNLCGTHLSLCKSLVFNRNYSKSNIPRLFGGLYHSSRKHCVYSKVCSIASMDVYLIVPP